LARGEAAEERVSQLRGEALKGAALPAPDLNGGGAARRGVDAAVQQPRLAAGGVGSGRHGREGPRRNDGIRTRGSSLPATRRGRGRPFFCFFSLILFFF
jgi:hypothetical protein